MSLKDYYDWKKQKIDDKKELPKLSKWQKIKAALDENYVLLIFPAVLVFSFYKGDATAVLLIFGGVLLMVAATGVLMWANEKIKRKHPRIHGVISVSVMAIGALLLVGALLASIFSTNQRCNRFDDSGCSYNSSTDALRQDTTKA